MRIRQGSLESPRWPLNPQLPNATAHAARLNNNPENMNHSSANHWTIHTSVVPLALMTLTGCASTGLDARMYTVKLTDAKVPVMLSDTRVRDVGTKVHARGIKSSALITGGNQYYSFSRSTEKESIFSPSEQLSIMMSGRTRFVQIRSIAFQAEDVNAAGFARTDRNLRVDAEVLP